MNERSSLLESRGEASGRPEALSSGSGDEENRFKEEENNHFQRVAGEGIAIFEKNLSLGTQERSRRYFLMILWSILVISFLGIIFHQQSPSPPLLASPLGSTSTESIVSSPLSMNLTLRWGIAGLGRISDDFAVALVIAGANITAVAAGSLPHSKSRALTFGERFGVLPSKCYGSYEELAADPEVDIVYIGNTNQLHATTALLMIDRFKHVLVEKPTAMTAQETKQMIAAAKAKGVLFSTNFWTRYFPAIKFAREQMSAGCIGDIVGIRGDFGFQAKPDPKDRYFNSAAGGGRDTVMFLPFIYSLLPVGALLDMGCYLIQFATLAHQSVRSYKKFLKSIRSSPHKHSLHSSSSSYFDNSLSNGAVGDRSGTLYPYEFSSLYPDVINANGLVGSDGVDVETSFLLRWKSQTLSRSLLEENEYRQLITPLGIDMIQSHPSDDLNFKGITGIFSTSLRRGSPFSVEIMGTHGFINIHDPANCPPSSVVNVGPDAYSSTPSEYQFPVKPLCNQNQVGPNSFSEPLPFRPAQFGPQYYPGTTGFVYIIQAVDHCLTGKGDYRSLPYNEKETGGDVEFRCLEMPELSSEEQVIIMEVTEAIQKETRP